MKNSTPSSAQRHIEAPFIRNIERLRQSEIRLVMRDRLESHPIDCVNWPAYPYAPRVTFRIAHSDEVLAIMFEVEEEHIRGLNTESNGAVWEDSCVEFFVANPAGEGYFNFEVNCISTALAALRRTRTDADHFDEEHIAQVRRFGSLPTAPIDSRGEGQQWWMVELIPFSLLGLKEPPQSLRCNFYKCGDRCSRPHFLSWSPIDCEEPNFHKPEFFGRVDLV